MNTENDIYKQLQKHIDSMPVPYPATQSGVELKLLKHLFSPKAAEVALCLSALPESLDIIHKRAEGEGLGIDQDEMETILDGLVKKGAIVSPSRDKKKRYQKAPLVIGMFEFQVNNLTKDYIDDFHEYMEEGFREAVFRPDTTKQMRTIPIGASLPADKVVGNYDDIRSLMEQSEGPFGIANCVCRQSKDLMGDPCKLSDEREVCLSFGNAAGMYIRDGRGRESTKEEVLKKLDIAQEQGMILQPENNQNPSFVCCCCGCCCEVLQNAKKFPVPAEIFHTNYFAAADQTMCTGCETCVSKCQMDALAVSGDTITIDLERCIGCGHCVSACPQNALMLHPRKHIVKPPKDSGAMYQKMMSERLGFTGTLNMMGKMMLKKKI